MIEQHIAFKCTKSIPTTLGENRQNACIACYKNISIVEGGTSYVTVNIPMFISEVAKNAIKTVFNAETPAGKPVGEVRYDLTTTVANEVAANNYTTFDSEHVAKTKTAIAASDIDVDESDLDNL